MTLQLFHLTKSYSNGDNREFLFENLTILFPKTGMIGICGRSGSGKSTLLNIIAGIEKTDYGKVIVDGKKLSSDISLRQYRKDYITFIYQYYNLIDALNVKDNIRLGLHIKGLTWNETKVRKLFKQFELLSCYDRYPCELSGGQKQRLAIIRAYLTDSPILLADEPTGAIHQQQAKQVMKLLRQYAKKHLVIIVSHDIDLLKQYVDHLIDFDHLKHHYLFQTRNNYERYHLNTKKKYLMSYYVISQMVKEKGKILMILLSQIFMIISFVLLICLKEGLSNYYQEILSQDPTKNQLYVFKNDYQNNSFTFDELLTFQTSEQTADYFYDLSLGRIQSLEEDISISYLQLPSQQQHLKITGDKLEKENDVYVNQELSDYLLDKKHIIYHINDKTIKFHVCGILDDPMHQDPTIYFQSSLINSIVLDKTKIESQIIVENYQMSLDKILQTYNNATYYSYSSYQDEVDNYDSLIQLASNVASIFLLVSFIISIILFSIVLSMIFMQRIKDSALLLAQGLSKSHLFILFLIETLLIGTIVSVIGSFISALFIFLINYFHLMQWVVPIPFQLIYPGKSYGIEMFLFLILTYEGICLLLSFTPIKNILRLNLSELLKEE